jgi:hypothetical protein
MVPSGMNRLDFDRIVQHPCLISSRRSALQKPMRVAVVAMVAQPMSSMPVPVRMAVVMVAAAAAAAVSVTRSMGRGWRSVVVAAGVPRARAADTATPMAAVAVTIVRRTCSSRRYSRTGGRRDAAVASAAIGHDHILPRSRHGASATPFVLIQVPGSARASVVTWWWSVQHESKMETNKQINTHAYGREKEKYKNKERASLHSSSADRTEGEKLY